MSKYLNYGQIKVLANEYKTNLIKENLKKLLIEKTVLSQQELCKFFDVGPSVIKDILIEMLKNGDLFSHTFKGCIFYSARKLTITEIKQVEDQYSRRKQLYASGHFRL